MQLEIIPLENEADALALASIRNECRHMMTRDQNIITEEAQNRWFTEFYQKQDPIHYRIWLLKQLEGIIFGYFAAKEEEDGFYITEGIAKEFRGKGAGSFLLKTLLSQELLKKKRIFADIFNDNLASIVLHKKFGFQYHSDVDSKIKRYFL